MRLNFIPIHVFRETPAVTFFDAGVSGRMEPMSLPTTVQQRHPLTSTALSSTTSTNIRSTTILS